MASGRCNGCLQVIFTSLYCFTWLLLIGGCVLFHVALLDVIPPVKDLPKNLEDGFYITFGFEHLEADSKQVMNASTQALSTCAVLPSACPYDTSVFNELSPASDTREQMGMILDTFNHSLQRINHVVNDKYLGTEQFRSTRDNLDTILLETRKLFDETQKITQQVSQGQIPCKVSVEAFCRVFTAAEDLEDGVATVKAEISRLTNGDEVQTYEDYSEYFDYLHAFPYVLVISAVFFAVFWAHGDAQCCCCGGSKLGCCFLILHTLFWLIFFVVNAVFVAAGYLAQNNLDDQKVKEVNGEPTIKDLLEHIKNNFPDFWDKVFQDMEGGLFLFWYAAVIFEVFCIIIMLYGCCIYCCKPYAAKKSEK